MMPDGLAEFGYFAKTVSSPLPLDILASLSEESSNSRTAAQRVASAVCELEDDGAINGRGQCLIAGPGKKLGEFHRGLGLSLARKFAGEKSEVYPTRSCFLYYETDDFSFFHHDAVHAHITLILGLTEGLLPLAMYPNFHSTTSEDVERLNHISCDGPEDFTRAIQKEFGRRGQIQEVEVRYGHALALRGRRVPHARPRQPVPGSVCTVCYSFLKPTADWMIA